MSTLSSAYKRAVERAKGRLVSGDRIYVSYDGGGQATFTFLGWTGPNNEWLDTASGYDLHPYNISKVNGTSVSFRDEAEAA